MQLSPRFRVERDTNALFTRSLFSTAHAAVLRDAPFAAIYYTAYEVMKDIQRSLLGMKKDEKLGRINNFIGGAAAGAFAAICTNPLDVVKTYVKSVTSLRFLINGHLQVFNFAVQILTNIVTAVKSHSNSIFSPKGTMEVQGIIRRHRPNWAHRRN